MHLRTVCYAENPVYGAVFWNLIHHLLASLFLVSHGNTLTLSTYAHNYVYLADEVGLGKTCTTVGFLLKETQNFQQKPGPSMAKPILVVVPPNIVGQWYNEILKITDFFEVYVYYGDSRSTSQRHTINKLNRSDKYFDGKPERARIVIITSYHTLNYRHGTTAQTNWQQQAKREKTKRQLDSLWPGNLSNCFRHVILNEAHMLRNLDTQMSQCLRWFKGEFNILLTATPAYNTISDFLGIAPFILDPKRQPAEAPAEFNPLRPTEETLPILFTLGGLRQHIFRSSLAPAAKGQALRAIWKRCVMRFSSYLQHPVSTVP